MAGDGYRVDYDALAELASVLEGLTGEFEGAEGEVGGYSAAMASDDVAGALKRFATNWSDDKKEIVELMENVSAYAEQAAAAYRDADETVQEGFADATGGDTSAPLPAAGEQQAV